MSNTVFDIPNNGQPNKLKVMVHDLSQPEATSTVLVDADSLGGEQSINIPTPIITVRNIGYVTNPTFRISEIHAHYLPCNETFLNHNPEYFLFRWKGKANKGRKRGFKHPSHMNGIKYVGSAWFAGKHDFAGDLDQGGTAPGGTPDVPVSGVPVNRITEWAFNANGAYKKTNLIGLDPQMYVINIDADGFGFRFPMTLIGGDGYEVQQGIRFLGQKKQNRNNSYINANGVRQGFNRKLKVLPFKLAIAIDNPEYTPTNGKCPKIFGQMSETFVFYLDFLHGKGPQEGTIPEYLGQIYGWRARVHNAYLRK